MARDMAEVQRNYNILCAELGQAVYKIAALESEIGSTERSIGTIKQKLKELNERAAKLSKNAPEAEEAQPAANALTEPEASSEQPQS